MDKPGIQPINKGNPSRCQDTNLEEQQTVTDGDFNCKKVRRLRIKKIIQSWGNRLLNLIMDNMLIQLVREDTIEGQEEELRLNLVFTNDLSDKQNVKYQCHLNK